jgi:hypothetical protein
VKSATVRPAAAGILGAALAVALIVAAAPASAQTIAPAFAGNYSYVDLGSVTSLPTNYGGLTLKYDDPNTLIIGGSANNSLGEFYAVPVTRDANHHITGFAGPATLYSDGANNDGGVFFGPGNVLFYARYPSNQLGQIKPGNTTTTDKVIDLTALGIPSSVGGIGIVPPGQPGAGQLQIATYSSGAWTSATLTPDGTGTYNVTGVTPHAASTLAGGPEGFIYVPTGSPVFTAPALLVSAWGAGRIDAYDVDANGDPIALTQRPFITGLSGAEGALIDPLTGDFLFSTYGGGNHLIAVRGFAALPEPSTALLLVGFAGAVVARRRRR